MKLTEHFTLEQMIFSQTAVRKGIDNTPTAEQITNLQNLCTNILEPLQASLGVIVLSSGFRCVTLNKAIGGASNSQHCQGMAADINIKGLNVEQVFQFIKHSTLPFDQVIQEFGSWVHVSFSPRNRRECLRATTTNGKTVYSVA